MDSHAHYCSVTSGKKAWCLVSKSQAGLSSFPGTCGKGKSFWEETGALAPPPHLLGTFRGGQQPGHKVELLPKQRITVEALSWPQQVWKLMPLLVHCAGDFSPSQLVIKPMSCDRLSGSYTMAALLLEHPGRGTARSSDSQHRVGLQCALLSLGKRKALGGN